MISLHMGHFMHLSRYYLNEQLFDKTCFGEKILPRKYINILLQYKLKK